MTQTTTTSTVSRARLGWDAEPAPTRADALEVTGRLPEWLTGTLVRVTPAGLDGARHWFDGLAMLHAFAIEPGRVGYANRWVESEDYRSWRDGGTRTRRGFASDPCRSIFQRVTAIFDPGQTDNPNVNVVRLGERWRALTEAPLAIEFDPETLETLGPVEWAGGRDHASAHPHYDFERRELVSYSVRFGPRSFYCLYSVPEGGAGRREFARLPVREPAYMHSFALTSRYAVLFDQPLVVNPLRLAFGDRPFIENYRWEPERGTRFLVVDRDTGALVAEHETDAFFTFHEVNAFEDGGELVVDLVAFEDSSIIDRLYLDNLRAEDPEVPPPGLLRRFRLPLNGGAPRVEDLCDEPLELPRIAYRTRNGRPYRYVYGAGWRGPDWIDRLLKVDLEDGEAEVWREDGCYPGEPVFVAAPGAKAEDDGVALSVVLDTAAERSFLLVLDAGTFEELARVEAPHAIPFGFHGDFARRED